MQNEERNERERLEIQGKYNLAMGIQLAREDFEREIEEIAQDDSLPSMPPERVEHFFSVIHAEQAKMRARKRRKAMRKKLIQFGAAAAAVLVLVPAIAMNVGASRTAIANYVIQNLGDYSTLQYDKENNVLPPFGWRSEYYPRWVPEGYGLSSVSFNSAGDYIWYTAADKQISFCILYSVAEPFLNSENRKTEEISINGQTAILYLAEDKAQATLFLPLADVLIQIEGPVPAEQVVKIAESIQI